jgi:hypothetical protein
MNAKKFTGEEGTLISSSKAATFTKSFREKKEKEHKKPNTYTEAQFFGNSKLKKLMKKEGCVGLRFYFGAFTATEFEDQLVVVAVDADGKDLTSTRIGLKDMPLGDDDALVGGPVCPHECNP